MDRAPEATVEALMFSLRRGVDGLTRALFASTPSQTWRLAGEE
jgi:hypothetical protein